MLERFMEEEICHIEILKEYDLYVARMDSELGGEREYRSGAFEGILRQIIDELRDEFDNPELEES